MRSLAVLAVPALFACAHDPVTPAVCSVSCAADQSCPMGLVCLGDGYCHEGSEEAPCNPDPPDAAWIDGVDPDADPDGDGLTNAQEAERGTDPTNPDSDGDSVLDGREVERNTNPLDPDSDGDGTSDGDEISIAVVADAFVRDGTYYLTNYGTEVELVVKADGLPNFTRETYLKFDVSAFRDASVTTATLALWPTDVGSDAATGEYEVRAVPSDSWGETTVTWMNRPAAGARVGLWAGATIVQYTPLRLDLTTVVNDARAGDGLLSLVIRGAAVGGSEGYVRFGSRETTAPPVLELVGAGVGR